MSISVHPKGFGALGAIIAIGIMGAIGAGLPLLVAANQHARTQVLHSAQASYSAKSGVEFARSLMVDEDPDNPVTIPTRHIMGESLVFDRSNSRVKVTATKGDAVKKYSISDTYQAKCLDIDLATGYVNQGQKKLLDIVLARNEGLDPNCDYNLTIVSLTASWTPDDNYYLRKIVFDNNFEFFDAFGFSSGTTFDLEGYFEISDSDDHDITYMQWSDLVSGMTITLDFNMDDGTSKSVVFVDGP